MNFYRNSLTSEIYCGDKLYPSDIQVDELHGVKTLQKQKITEARYNEEVSGVVVGDQFIDTDRTTQTRIAQAFSLTQLNPEKTFNWKTTDNKWKVLTSEDVRFLSETIGEHVQYCFDKEMNLHTQIDACETVDDVLNISW